MAFAAWSEEYSLGIPEIDQQHKALFGAVDELHTAFMEQKEGLKVGQVIEFMEVYAKTHFQTEERLMEKHPFPNRDSHLEGHRAFEEQVMEFLPRAPHGTRMLSMEVLHFLKDWLTHHINDTDRRMFKPIR